jgi:hypothetical protein
LTKEELLAEVDDLLRLTPLDISYNIPENIAWVGRAAALVTAWDPVQSSFFSLYYQIAQGPASTSDGGKAQLIALVQQMRFDLLMKTRGPLNRLVERGMVFDYFNELRKVLEPARQDLFFVDPYLDAEFVERYLPHVFSGVPVRLLAREKLPTLLPAVTMFVKQSPNVPIEVRSAPAFHDRYVFVDRAACYQSGASFKDGGRSAPTTLTQITDAFAAVLKMYETIWSGAKVER